MITLDISKDDCRNAAEVLELYIPLAIKDFYEAGDLDNVYRIKSIVKVFEELDRAGNEKEHDSNSDS